MSVVPTLSLQQAGDALAAGGLVAHSTTSLLGIAADPLSVAALDRLDALKRRSAGRGYVHAVGDLSDAVGWAEELERAAPLWQACDGPLTLVLPAGPAAPARCVVPQQGGGATFALRVDRHPVVMGLTAHLGRPIVSTSLNLAGQPPASTLLGLPDALATALVGAVTSAPAPLGLPSTLALWTGSGWRVLREGAVSAAQLERAALP